MAQIDLLSDVKIKALRPRQKAYRVADGRAMYMLVTPTGGKSWRLKFRHHGNQRTLALGMYPDVGIAEARAKRDAARALIAKGIDPVAVKRGHSEDGRQRTAYRFAEAAEAYFEHNAKAWSEAHQRDVRRILDELKATLADKPMDAIQPEDVEAVLGKVEDRDALAVAKDMRLYFRCVVKFYNVKNRKHRIADPSADVVIKKAPKVRHHPALDPSEVGAFLRRLQLCPAMPLVRIATRLLMLTAVRTTELRKATWREIDTKAKLWRIPAHRMKAGVEHVVPLSPQVLELLATLRTLTGEGDLLFPNLLDPEQPMSPNTIISNIKNMGYAGRATGHGMRSTFSTWCNENGFRADAIERQLAHAPRDAIRAAYLHSEFLTERKRMMGAWADFLDDAEHGGKVVSIRTGTAHAH